jgi:peptidyl-prolyl cis-trans isomerase A (cyclophilin A)
MTASTDNAPSRIFISYRREDTSYSAAWLYERLASHFGRSQIFKDIDSIELGDDFVEVITTAIGSCDVLLALIGNRWLVVTGRDGRRRLDDPSDFVRLEIEAALTRNVRLIPILVDEAQMPRADELPTSLAMLARRQALKLSPGSFDADTQRLLRVLDRTTTQTQERVSQATERVDRKEAVHKPLGLIATLQTSLGRIVVRLFPDHAPKTVRNFVELAEGGREWTDPRTGRATRAKLYDGTVFHRVIPDFMIQGGDPFSSGRGGPGYKFADEIHPDLVFDRPYLLAMANAGPGTNGSQFFITVVPTPWLNGKHTIFGEVIEGADVVDKISKVKTESLDKPTTDVALESVTIDRSAGG